MRKIPCDITHIFLPLTVHLNFTERLEYRKTEHKGTNKCTCDGKAGLFLL